MERKQPFFHLEKSSGDLQVTLGPSFGQAMVLLMAFFLIAFLGEIRPELAGSLMPVIKEVMTAVRP